jgi:hypothetical protein
MNSIVFHQLSHPKALRTLFDGNTGFFNRDRKPPHLFYFGQPYFFGPVSIMFDTVTVDTLFSRAFCSGDLPFK